MINFKVEVKEKFCEKLEDMLSKLIQFVKEKDRIIAHRNFELESAQLEQKTIGDVFKSLRNEKEELKMKLLESEKREDLLTKRQKNLEKKIKKQKKHIGELEQKIKDFEEKSNKETEQKSEKGEGSKKEMVENYKIEMMASQLKIKFTKQETKSNSSNKPKGANKEMPATRQSVLHNGLPLDPNSSTCPKCDNQYPSHHRMRKHYKKLHTERGQATRRGGKKSHERSMHKK